MSTPPPPQRSEGAPLQARPEGPPYAPLEYPAEGAVGGKNYASWLLFARKKYDRRRSLALVCKYETGKYIKRRIGV